ncbi:endo-1,4-beta-glucanase [Jimgerdemannia flammicorona]|uniref:Endo-1,4-beta-glucanase n=1 Tax=Jimgerdemannia flammicorona TaxID=994334 RepID=A0A433QWC0_9FUNG|nr:endo-1,4-beta-glucanase [Jimgerdemannia flammicorona]
MIHLKFSILASALLGVLSAVGDAASVTPYKWGNVKIGGGGFVPGIVYSSTQSGLLYARTDIGGAYRWTASKPQWTPITDIFSAASSNFLGVESIATDAKDPKRLYIAVGQYVKSWAGNGAILASKNQGNTWTTQWNASFPMGSNEDGRGAGERLAVNPVNNNIIFFGSRTAGLWMSTNYGQSFTLVTSKGVFFGSVTSLDLTMDYIFYPTPPTDNNGKGIVFVQFAPNTRGQTVFAGSHDFNNPLYRSTNGGKTWSSVSGQPKGYFPMRSAFSSDGRSLYVTYSNGPGPNGVTNGAVWKYTLSSGEWTDITPKKPKVNSNPSFGYSGVSTDAKNPEIVVVSTINNWALGDDVYRSLDGGSTWKSLKSTAVQDIKVAPWLKFGKTAPGFGWWISDVKIDPFNSNRILYVTGATIYGSTDVNNADSGKQTHWSPVTKGLEETSVQDLASPPSGPALFDAIGDLGGFTHQNVSRAAQMWTNPMCSSGSSVNFAGQKPSYVARAGTDGGGYSVNAGKTWKKFTGVPPNGSGGLGKIAVSADGKTIVWTPSNADAYWSRNNGTNWTAVSGLNPANLAVVADGWDPKTFYAYDTNSGTLWASTNSGKTFVKRATGVVTGSGVLNTVYGSKGTGDLWLASDDGLYHSTNGGKTFSKITGVTSAEAVGFGAPASGSSYSVTVYIAGVVDGFYGVHRSVDGGTTWTQLNDAKHQWGWIGKKVIGDPRKFGRVYVATNGRGIVLGDDAS